MIPLDPILKILIRTGVMSSFENLINHLFDLMILDVDHAFSFS